MGNGLERARRHGRRCGAGSVMMVMMPMVFMMMVRNLALTTARLMLMRELIIYENDVKY